ncbi:MAG: hypothetical protein JO091_03015 [Acidobacteriaceae bacterium]|nr:hypothetical protein [Acidobacteriaceae bacterium]
MELFKRWQGFRRYRCRECGKVFHRPLDPGELASISRMEERRARRSSRRGGLLRRKGAQRVAETLLFFGALVIFYVAIKYFDRVS